MATNPYFKQGVRSEQNVYEDIIIEALKMYGQDVYYLPREIVNKDKIFGDDVPSRFGSSYKVEMYIENTEAFDGEGDLFTKFGIELRDQANFIVSRKRWKQLVGTRLSENNFRPREGDLIYLTLSNSMFEIRRVETETPFYQLSQLPTFRMQCELFEYNDEDFDTGIDAIQEIEVEDAFQYALTLDSASVGYTVGETVEQTFATYTMRGEVSDWSDSDRVLQLVHVGATDGKFHTFNSSNAVVSESATYSPTLVEELNYIQQVDTVGNSEPVTQNDYFDNFEGDFLDFSENNPFGDIS